MESGKKKGITLIAIRKDGAEKWIPLQEAIRQQDNSQWFPPIQRFYPGIGGMVRK